MNEKIKKTRKIPIKKLFRELDIDSENAFAESLNEVISEQDELDFDDDGNPKELFFD